VCTSNQKRAEVFTLVAKKSMVGSMVGVNEVSEQYNDSIFRVNE
jgi:hypothetical protein